MMDQRVAVTGVGILTPIGIGVDAFWTGLLAGRSGVGPIGHFDASGLPAREFRISARSTFQVTLWSIT